MRLQKFMATCGVASRRKSEKIILDGRVKVNGKIITELGTKINPEKDIVKVDNKIIELEENDIYILLNKPVGYVTTTKEQFGRKKVLDLIKGVKERIYPVGRLDYDTSGLLILTNDGELTYKLTHPSHEIKKTYIAIVRGVPTKSEIMKLRRGVVIDGYKTSKSEVEILKNYKNKSILKIIIHEGRNRQVRKMCESINHPVIELERVSIEDIQLGNLKVGEWRYLTNEEIKYLKNI